MYFNTIAAAVLAAVPTVMALPNYAIPMAFSRITLANDCIYPGGFEVNDLVTFRHIGVNSTQDDIPDITFGFYDASTGIETSCSKNVTSKNVARPDLTPRWSCDDPLVQFIWQDNELTLLKTACPGSTGSSIWEASGSLQPGMFKCAYSGCNTTATYGVQCTAIVTELMGNYTSLQQRP